MKELKKLYDSLFEGQHEWRKTKSCDWIAYTFIEHKKLFSKNTHYFIQIMKYKHNDNDVVHIKIEDMGLRADYGFPAVSFICTGYDGNYSKFLNLYNKIIRKAKVI